MGLFGAALRVHRRDFAGTAGAEWWTWECDALLLLTALAWLKGSLMICEYASAAATASHNAALRRQLALWQLEYEEQVEARLLSHRCAMEVDPPETTREEEPSAQGQGGGWAAVCNCLRPKRARSD